MDLNKSQNDIVKVNFWINIIILAISIFYKGLGLFYTALLINILLMGVHLIITKKFLLFQGLLTANTFANKLNNRLGEVHGQVSG